jgi:hypothetical protein
MNILLDYFFKVTAIIGAQAASTAFLKQVLVVAKPKSGQSGNVGSIFTCTSASAVAARTDNTECTQLFNAGMGRVYLLLADDLDIAEFIEGNQNFFTILISSDFSDAEIDLAAAYGTITITSYANWFRELTTRSRSTALFSPLKPAPLFSVKQLIKPQPRTMRRPQASQRRSMLTPLQA